MRKAMTKADVDAIIGAAGLATGFAPQGSLGNFAAGVMLIFFRPFKAGDFVEAGGVAGVVEDIQVFATVIRTGDNKEITGPNSSITGGSITNYSAKPTRPKSRLHLENTPSSYSSSKDGDSHQGKKSGKSSDTLSENAGGRFSKKLSTPSRASGPLPK